KPRTGQRNPRKSKPVCLVSLGLTWVRLGVIWPEARAAIASVWLGYGTRRAFGLTPESGRSTLLRAHPALLQEGAIDFVVAAQARHPAELVDQNDRISRGAAERDRRAHSQIDRRHDDIEAGRSRRFAGRSVRPGQRPGRPVQGDADRPIGIVELEAYSPAFVEMHLVVDAPERGRRRHQSAAAQNV